jgi:hypothetical protein
LEGRTVQRDLFISEEHIASIFRVESKPSEKSDEEGGKLILAFDPED